MKNLRKQGFSLIELIVVIAVIAAIAAIIIPSISGTNDAAKRQRAIAAAEALNIAQVQYRMAEGATAWAALDNAARYVELRDYMTYAQTTLADFQENIDSRSRYTFTFQAFTTAGYPQKVQLFYNGSTTPIDY